MTERAPTSASRSADLAWGVRLEYTTLGWNVFEGGVGTVAALAAGSIALLGFGLDSLVENASAGILIWRLSAERGTRTAEDLAALDRRAHKLVGLTLFALAAYVGAHALYDLWKQQRPEPSVVGLLLMPISTGFNIWLARAKRRAAAALGSRALEADSFQTTVCWWLALMAFGGLGMNAAFGWWWADPLAALAMTPLIVREGLEAWRVEDE